MRRRVPAALRHGAGDDPGRAGRVPRCRAQDGDVPHVEGHQVLQRLGGDDPARHGAGAEVPARARRSDRGRHRQEYRFHAPRRDGARAVCDRAPGGDGHGENPRPAGCTGRPLPRALRVTAGSCRRGDRARRGSGRRLPVSVLFSPGCTSFGMFQNEFDRGRKFKEVVLSLTAKE